MEYKDKHGWEKRKLKILAKVHFERPKIPHS